MSGLETRTTTVDRCHWLRFWLGYFLLVRAPIHINPLSSLGVAAVRQSSDPGSSSLDASGAAANPTAVDAAVAAATLGVVSAPEGADLTGAAKYPSCGATFENTLCLKDGAQIILPPARPPGLVGSYSFDEIYPADSSVFKNHAQGETLAGPPASGGPGASAMFRQSYLVIPHHMAHIATNESSWSFWFLILKDRLSNATAAAAGSEAWCPIVIKGSENLDGTYSVSPGIYLNPSNGRLKITMMTEQASASSGEYFVSNSKLQPQRWYKLTATRSSKRWILYVNGIVDTVFDSEGAVISNTLPIYVGYTPTTAVATCDVPLLIDDLRFYNSTLGPLWVQADSSAALGGTEPAYVHLSCMRCTRLEAEQGCPSTHHLCTKEELTGGVATIARGLGWTSASDLELWTGRSASAIKLDTIVASAESNVTQVANLTTASEGTAAGANPESPGVGVCCMDP